MRAAEEGYVEIVKALINAGADVNAKTKEYPTFYHDVTPLHKACSRWTTVTGILIEAGANVNVIDSKRRTPGAGAGVA